ncbi:MAG: PepSY domain-containing protein [Cyanobacteriota bacterium]|nr:PepSY domain-containing protein [Cyanobacteriota bacterium]
MATNKARLRRIHAWLAPIMFLPVILTLITGSLFQVAVLTGKSNEFLWLLDWHRGKFGRINLEIIYPFLNAFGVLMLASTGIAIWLQTRQPKTSRQHSR